MEEVGLPIDDTYMRQTLAVARNAPTMAPRPWERREWFDFVEKCEDQGIEYHLTEEERALKQIKRDSQKTLEMMGHGKKQEVVNKDLFLTPQQLARQKLPNRQKPQRRLRTLNSRPGSRVGTASPPMSPHAKHFCLRFELTMNL